MTIVALGAGLDMARPRARPREQSTVVPQIPSRRLHMRNFFVHLCNLKLVLLCVAAFTLAAPAQETASAADYERPWQHFAQSGAGVASDGSRVDEAVFQSPATGK